MDIKKKNKVLIWTSIVLLALNISTIGAIWIEKQMDKKTYKELRNPNPKDILISELNMNEAQMQSYRNSRKKHWQLVRLEKQSIHKAKQRIHDELFKSHPDTQYINQLIDTIGSLNASIERITYFHFLELKENMDSSQEVKFQHIMDEMLQHNHRKSERFREKREHYRQNK